MKNFLCDHGDCKRPRTEGAKYCWDHCGADGTICAVADCRASRTLASVLCGTHAALYYEWRKKVDLSQIPGESSCVYWMANPNKPAPKPPLRPGQIIAHLIALQINEELGLVSLPKLKDCELHKLFCLAVKVKPSLHFDDYAGRVIYDEDEEGEPAKYQAVDGWYASPEDAREAIESLKGGIDG